VAEYFGHLAELYDELAVIADRFIEQGDAVAVLGRIVATPLDGTPFEQTFVHSWEFTNGLASRFTEFYDTVRVNAALGLAVAVDLNQR
jgi:ketosteroid isomerase-like protein